MCVYVCVASKLFLSVYIDLFVHISVFIYLSSAYLFCLCQAYGQVKCSWTGFVDNESPIDAFTFFVGTAPGLYDVIGHVTLEGYVTSYSARKILFVTV